MSGDVQVRFCERPGVRFPRATHLVVGFERRNEAEQVLTELQSGGAALHVISLGQPGNTLADETRNRDQVIALGTERTGGRRDNVISFTAAPGKMKQLADELKNQYVVSYSRPERLIPPEKIEVTVTRPGLTARARTRIAKAGTK